MSASAWTKVLVWVWGVWSLGGFGAFGFRMVETGSGSCGPERPERHEGELETSFAHAFGLGGFREDRRGGPLVHPQASPSIFCTWARTIKLGSSKSSVRTIERSHLCSYPNPFSLNGLWQLILETLETPEYSKRSTSPYNPRALTLGLHLPK